MHPRSDGVNIICAAFDFCIYCRLFSGLDYHCALSLPQLRNRTKQFPTAPVFIIIPYQAYVEMILFELHLMNFCIGELTLKGLGSIGHRFTKYYTYCFIKKINRFPPLK